MQIILVHQKLAKAKTITLSLRHLVAVLLGLLVFCMMGASLLYYLTFRHAAEIRLPIVRDLLMLMNADELRQKDKYVRENLNAMATKLGEMQAQLLRLDALGERVSGLAGVKAGELNFRETPGRGGLNHPNARDMNMTELQQAVDSMSRGVEQRTDYLTILESELFNQKLKSKMLPSAQPVSSGFTSSGFGWRIDPFTGRSTLHEGIDFVAPVGTPILAAAGGVVITAEYHPAYGNMVEVDHGNNLVTRYAHASALHVKVGDVVKRHQKIAAIGSTGRSTGAHLHFEVHVNGQAQDPVKFLAQNSLPNSNGQPTDKVMPTLVSKAAPAVTNTLAVAPKPVSTVPKASDIRSTISTESNDQKNSDSVKNNKE